MIFKNPFFFILTLLLLTEMCHAQKDTHSISIKYHKGVILPHHKSVSYVRKSDTEAIEVNFGFIPSSKRQWAKLYSQPEIGIAFYHGNLGNNEVWGKVNALFPYVNFHLFKKSRFHLVNHLGLGVSYNNKVFHPTKNYKNTLISSRVNAFFSLSLNTEFSINPQLQLIAGLGLKHISNGASKHPNSGINLLTSNFGIKYALNSRPEITYHKARKYSRLDNEYSIAWNHGRKQAKENDLHRYYISNISASYAIGINAKQRIGFGLDLFYNEAANRGIWDYEPKTEFEDRISQGVHISHQLVISKFALIAQLGAYTLFKTKPEAAIYSRVSLRYSIGRHFFANFNLKAHGGKADNLEWGIGYKFKGRSKQTKISNENS